MEKAKPNCHLEFLPYVDSRFEADIIPELMEYIKIPAMGPLYDAKWKENGHLLAAMERIASWCKRQSFNYSVFEVLNVDGRTPFLYMEIPAFNYSGNDTILMYGHMDKQPEMSGWTAPLAPWNPVRRGELLYGRGGADDGYSVFSSLLAIETLEHFKIPHPKCCIMIEGSEECGSIDLPFYVDLIKKKYNLQAPKLVVCLDSGAGNFEQLWATTSLRGNMTANLEIECLREGIHSGLGSGVVPNPFDVLRILLDRIQNPVSGEMIPEALQVEIPAQRLEQIKNASAILEEQIPITYPIVDGLELYSGSKPIRKTWKPSFSVTGIDGLPPTNRAGNVTIPKVAVKISLRLPPTLEPLKAAKVLEEILLSNPPQKAKINLRWDTHSGGWNAPETAPWLDEAMQKASMEYFKKPAQYMGEGGTIPFMGMLSEQFPKAQFLITGVLGPQSNAHGPNEFLHLGFTKKLTACLAFILGQI